MIDIKAGFDSRARLATYKSLASRVAPGRWQEYRWRARQRPSYFAGNWDADKERYLVDHRHQLVGRDCGWSDAILPFEIRHSGWFTSEEGDDGTVRGLVMQLPARRHGKQARGPIYYPAIVWSDCDMVTSWPGEWYDNKEQAAREADEYAREAAEKDAEANRIHQLEGELEDLHDAIRENRQTLKGLVQGIRQLNAPLPDALCALVRQELRALRADNHAGLRRIRKIRHNLERS